MTYPRRPKGVNVSLERGWFSRTSPPTSGSSSILLAQRPVPQVHHLVVSHKYGDQRWLPVYRSSRECGSRSSGSESQPRNDIVGWSWLPPCTTLRGTTRGREYGRERKREMRRMEALIFPQGGIVCALLRPSLHLYMGEGGRWPVGPKGRGAAGQGGLCALNPNPSRPHLIGPWECQPLNRLPSGRGPLMRAAFSFITWLYIQY
jgi:hypothetical protein